MENKYVVGAKNCNGTLTTLYFIPVYVLVLLFLVNQPTPMTLRLHNHPFLSEGTLNITTAVSNY